ncbi:PREDICTED: uncharacterized protein LOC106807307 [Priapulus caudatus]|uniref:Uncharacterized protein LOC106807307 n=1 Tax=Priapulus caudatus TaxID=37621 RepID=A0ABM1DYT2_PRICU|nr:PREDICTED: uncharacterized protein LOC106807307 [Priapulus caudatus]
MKFLAAALLLLGLLAASASAVADSVDLTFAFLAQTNATTCVRGTGTVLPVHLDNDRWKLEANIAVQAATLVGQLWDPDLQTNDDFDDLLYAIVTSNVRSRQMIYGSAIAFVKDGYRDGVRLFAPYAFRRNAGVSSIDLSRRYDYTTSDSEWFYKVLEDSKNKQLNTAYTRRRGRERRGQRVHPIVRGWEPGQTLLRLRTGNIG